MTSRKPAWALLALLSLLFALGACRRDETADAAKAPGDPVAAVKGLAGALRDNDLVRYSRLSLPPDLHARSETLWQRRQAQAEPPTAEDAREYADLMARLTAPDAETALMTDLEPKLREAGIKILSYDELKGRQRRLLRHHFRSEIFPVLTPLAFDPGHPFPHISNLSMNLAVVVQDPVEGEKFARLRVPQSVARLLRIPEEEKADSYEKLGLAENERIAGFVYIGTPMEKPEERERPNLADIVTRWGT